MAAQFDFFGSSLIHDDKRPIMAGLNYFLTHGARGGEGKQLLGEKRDVKVWLSWLERLAHKEVATIETPIGYLPRYDDLKSLFAAIIDKDYPEDLYTKQFSLYIDHILGRIALQKAAYSKDENIPSKLFAILDRQREALEALKAAHGPIVPPQAL